MGERAPVTPDDVRAAAAAVREALEPHLDADWSVPAGCLDWDCRDTLAHIPEALGFYAGNLATLSRERRPYPMAEVFGGTPEVWLRAMESAAAVLARVAEATPLGERGFHPAGLADAEGFLAMGCDEVLVHGADVADGLGVPFQPPDALAARVVARLFPWVEPRDGEGGWQLLHWCNGRVALPGRERLGADWWWWCAPLDEWDGSGPRTRTVPPARR